MSIKWGQDHHQGKKTVEKVRHNTPLQYFTLIYSSHYISPGFPWRLKEEGEKSFFLTPPSHVSSVVLKLIRLANPHFPETARLDRAIDETAIFLQSANGQTRRTISVEFLAKPSEVCQEIPYFCGYLLVSCFFRRVNCCGHHHRPPIKLSSVLSTFPRVFGWPASWRVCVVRKPSLELGLRNFTLCYKFGQ